MNRKAQEMVDKACSEIKTLSVEEALQIHQEDSAIFIDVRDLLELWREGKIVKAFHAPRGMLEFWIDGDSPYHNEIFAKPSKFIFYCSLGWRSALAAQTAQQMGIKKAMHIEGGYKAWLEAQGEVEPVASPLDNLSLDDKGD